MQQHGLLGKIHFCQNSLNSSDLYVTFFNNIHQIPDDILHQALPPDNIFLQKNYLLGLESARLSGIRSCYVVFQRGRQPVGFAAMQIKDFNAGDSLKPIVAPEDAAWCVRLSQFVKQRIAKRVRFNTLVLGNLLLTGQHGYWFEKSVSEAEKSNFILKGIDIAKQNLEKQGISISAVFAKDFFPSEQPEIFASEGFNEFQVEPNLIFELSQDWKTYQDYLDALGSKYRVRAKRAAKKAEKLEKKVFNPERIKAHLPQIHALYQGIAAGADFNLVTLPVDYQWIMQQHLEDAFQLTGYFLEGQLVAFFTTIKNYEHTEACFLGYDKNLNNEYQIYLNILLDIVKNGIENRSKSIIFARTASEIKTSVGAVAREMSLYLKHYNPIVNKILPPILPMLSPRAVWEARHPFKG